MQRNTIMDAHSTPNSRTLHSQICPGKHCFGIFARFQPTQRRPLPPAAIGGMRSGRFGVPRSPTRVRLYTVYLPRMGGGCAPAALARGANGRRRHIIKGVAHPSAGARRQEAGTVPAAIDRADNPSVCNCRLLLRRLLLKSSRKGSFSSAVRSCRTSRIGPGNGRCHRSASGLVT